MTFFTLCRGMAQWYTFFASVKNSMITTWDLEERITRNQL